MRQLQGQGVAQCSCMTSTFNLQKIWQQNRAAPLAGHGKMHMRLGLHQELKQQTGYLSVGIAADLPHDEVIGEGGQLLHTNDGHLLLLALLLTLCCQLVVYLQITIVTSIRRCKEAGVNVETWNISAITIVPSIRRCLEAEVNVETCNISAITIVPSIRRCKEAEVNVETCNIVAITMLSSIRRCDQVEVNVETYNIAAITMLPSIRRCDQVEVNATSKLSWSITDTSHCRYCTQDRSFQNVS